MEEIPAPDDTAPGRTGGGAARGILRWSLVFVSGVFLTAGLCRLVEAAREFSGSLQFHGVPTAAAWLLSAGLVYPWRSRARRIDPLPATARKEHHDAETGRRCMVRAACGMVMAAALWYAFQRFTEWRDLTKLPDNAMPWITHLESAALGAWTLAYAAALLFCAAFRFRLRSAAREDVQRTFFFAGAFLSGLAVWALHTAWLRAKVPMDSLAPVQDPWWHALACLLAVWMAGAAAPRLVSFSPGAPVFLPALEDVEIDPFSFLMLLILAMPLLALNALLGVGFLFILFFGSGSWFYQSIRKAAKTPPPPEAEQEEEEE